MSNERLQRPDRPEADISPLRTIDPYDPQAHPDTATHVEPLLADFAPEEAARRRAMLGIIVAADWLHSAHEYIFVAAEALPFQDEEEYDIYGPEFIDPYGFGLVEMQLEPGQYASNNGRHVAMDAHRRIFVSLTQIRLDRKGYVTDGATALYSRGFEQGSSCVPFSNEPWHTFTAAIYNAAVPGLATSYVPDQYDFRDAGLYRFRRSAKPWLEGPIVAVIPDIESPQEAAGTDAG